MGDVDGQVHIHRNGLVIDLAGTVMGLLDCFNDSRIPERVEGFDDLDVLRPAGLIDRKCEADACTGRKQIAVHVCGEKT